MPTYRQLYSFTVAFLFLACVDVRAQECPFTRLNDTEQAINKTAGCDAAIALYESCGAKASSQRNLFTLAAAAQKRCEQGFLDDLHGRLRQKYKRMDTSCYKQDTAPSLFYSARSMCGPYLSQKIFHIMAKEKAEKEKNSNPPL